MRLPPLFFTAVLPLFLAAGPLPALDTIPEFSRSQFQKAREIDQSEEMLRRRAEREAANHREEKERQGKDGSGETRETQLQEAPPRLSPQENLFLEDLQRLDPSWDARRFRREMPAFGYDFFASTPPAGETGIQAPVGPDYRLGPRDGLMIHLWNNTVDEVFPAEIGRDGRLIIPKGGEIQAAGMKLGDLETRLVERFQRIYSAPSVSVSLGRIRSITVYVVGEVVRPGSYSLHSLSTLLSALIQAGGPTPRGSLRKIRLKRRGGDALAVDLYDFLLRGDREQDLRLDDGDSLFVPVIGPTVMIHGEVRRPGLYELKDRTSLQDALEMAGGISSAGFRGLVQLVRTSRHARRQMTDVAASDRQRTWVQDGDSIHVTPVYRPLENFVRISGNVERPGQYQWLPGMRLRDLLSRGVRLLPRTHLARADLLRRYGKKQEYDYAQTRIKSELESEIVPIELGPVLDGDKKSNLELKPGDELVVYRSDDVVPEPTVRIAGAVRRPGTYPLIGGMTLRDLLFRAGNVQPHALLDRVELMRRVYEGSETAVYREELLVLDLRRALDGDPLHNVKLTAWDSLNVLAVSEEILQKKVLLRGEVKNPGEYIIRDGERLSSLLRRAGGFAERAFLEGAVFSRQSARRQQQEGLRQQVEELKRKVAEVQSEMALRAEEKASPDELRAVEAQQKRIEEFAGFEPQGRVQIRILPLAQLTGSPFDVELKNGDQLYIPEIPAEVTVLGEVVNPGSLLFEEGRTVDDYIQRMGGPTAYADRGRVYVVKADGTTVSRVSFQRGRSRFHLRYETDLTRRLAGGSFERMKVERGDVIHVPARIVSKRTSTQELVDMVYKITLTFAGMKAAFN